MNESLFFRLFNRIFDYLGLTEAARIYLRAIYVGFGFGFFITLLAKLYTYWYRNKYCPNLLADSKKKSVNKLTKKGSTGSITKYRGGIVAPAILAQANIILEFIGHIGVLGGTITGAVLGIKAMQAKEGTAEVRNFFKYITPQSLYSDMQLQEMQKAARALQPIENTAVFIECCRRFKLFTYLINQLPDRDISLAAKKQAIDNTLQSKQFAKLISENRGMTTTVVVCLVSLLEFVYRNDRELFLPFLTDLLAMVKNKKLKLVIFRAVVRGLRKAGVPIPSSVEEFLEENLEEVEV